MTPEQRRIEHLEAELTESDRCGMNESLEITALRLAMLVLKQPEAKEGWLLEARKIAADIVAEFETPAPPSRPLPVAEKPETRIAIHIHIRWMIRRDMPEVLEIESHSFEHPWDEEDFIRCLRQRNCIGMIAEFDERVVGYMIYSLHKTRLHLVGLAVHRDFRWKSVGRQFMNKLKSKLSIQRRPKLLLEVREKNVPAQCFFKALGFRATAVLKEFYEDTDEDAIQMQYMVPATVDQKVTGGE